MVSFAEESEAGKVNEKAGREKIVTSLYRLRKREGGKENQKTLREGLVFEKMEEEEEVDQSDFGVNPFLVQENKLGDKPILSKVFLFFFYFFIFLFFYFYFYYFFILIIINLF